MATPAPAEPQVESDHPGERVVEPSRNIAGTDAAGPVAAPDRRRWWYVVGAAAVVIGVAAVVAAVLEIGPGWLDQLSAIVLSTTLTVALAARTGGRPLVFGGLALAFGVAAVATDSASRPPQMRTVERR